MKPANFARILLVTLLLAGYSAWVLHTRARPNGLPIGDRAVLDIPLLGLADVKPLWEQDSTLFVDVRSAFDFDVGHIAGAVNLPYEEFDARWDLLKPRLERAVTVVVYCKSVDCGTSLWSALRLRQRGLARVVIYPEGWNEWFNRGLPVGRS